MRSNSGLSFLLILFSSTALAEPGFFGRDARSDIRGLLLEGTSVGLSDSRGAERHRNTDYAFPENGNSISVQVPGNAASSSESARRQGRLSPEQRRTLRRQIDEAGHDIYNPGR